MAGQATPATTLLRAQRVPHTVHPYQPGQSVSYGLAAAEAEQATGYIVGGISPLGHRKRLPVVLDLSAHDWETLFCGAGRRGLQVELAPADLARLTSAVFAPLAN